MKREGKKGREKGKRKGKGKGKGKGKEWGKGKRERKREGKKGKEEGKGKGKWKGKGKMEGKREGKKGSEAAAPRLLAPDSPLGRTGGDHILWSIFRNLFDLLGLLFGVYRPWEVSHFCWSWNFTRNAFKIMRGLPWGRTYDHTCKTSVRNNIEWHSQNTKRMNVGSR